jgi:hypothetical protein
MAGRTNIETMAGDPTLATAGAATRCAWADGGRRRQLSGTLDVFDATNAIKAAYVDGAGNADALKVYDAGDTQRENGRLSASELVGMGMTLGIGYTGFDVLKAWLSDNDNVFYVESTHTGVTYLDLGDEQPVLNGTNDILNINSISGPTTVDAGNGNDIIRVNFDSQGKQTFRSGIDGELTLHGQQGSDLYEIGLAGEISSRINVDQSRATGQPAAHLRHQPVDSSCCGPTR